MLSEDDDDINFEKVLLTQMKSLDDDKKKRFSKKKFKIQ